MLTEMSAVPPRGVSGTGTLLGAPICSPETKAHVEPAGQAAQPLERTRQVLVNPSPGRKVVPSGTVTSATKLTPGRQGVGVGVLVGARVGVGVRVGVAVRDGVKVGVFVRVGVFDGVGIGVRVNVGVLVCVGVLIGADVFVGAGAGVETEPQPDSAKTMIQNTRAFFTYIRTTPLIFASPHPAE